MNGGFESYGEAFLFDLHEMYRGSEDTRRDWFEWWLTRATFDCISCESEFTPKVTDIEEDDEFRCPKCAAKRNK